MMQKKYEKVTKLSQNKPSFFAVRADKQFTLDHTWNYDCVQKYFSCLFSHQNKQYLFVS